MIKIVANSERNPLNEIPRALRILDNVDYCLEQSNTMTSKIWALLYDARTNLQKLFKLLEMGEENGTHS